MLSSVVSFLLFAALDGTTVSQSNSVWRQIEPSVAVVQSNGATSGVAVLIDDTGLFLTHATAAEGQLSLSFSDGFTTSALLVATDDQTQLSLVKALIWTVGKRRVLSVSQGVSNTRVPLISVTSAGPRTGEFVTEDRAGVMRPSLRYVPLSEVRLEATNDLIGGALLFDASGSLFGVLGATLAQQDTGQAQTQGGIRQKSLADFAPNALESVGANKFGPRGVTVGYALGHQIVARVVKGFVSPGHKVQHPTIGVFFKANATGKGVLIESVMAASPAARAGLMPGDVIYEIDGTPTNSAIGLAVALFKKEPGDKAMIRFGRGDQKGLAAVEVEGSQAPLGL